MTCLSVWDFLDRSPLLVLFMILAASYTVTGIVKSITNSAAGIIAAWRMAPIKEEPETVEEDDEEEDEDDESGNCEKP